MMAEETEASLQFWNDLWANNKNHWHIERPHQMLVKYENWLRIVENCNDVRVLVPLCGKSVDLKWLYDRGYEVVGVECR